MKILKEEKIEEYECPKCNGALEMDGNELNEEKLKSFLYKIFPFGDITTDNAWFICVPCNKRYLIKDYARQEVSEDA